MAPLAEAQAAVDERLLAFVATLTDEKLAAETRVHRTGRIQVERTDDLLLHLFMHQTHHRGQVHAMLSGSSVAPPQLDEFLTASDFRDRIADVAALGWSEAELQRGAAPAGSSSAAACRSAAGDRASCARQCRLPSCAAPPIAGRGRALFTSGLSLRNQE